MAANTKIQGMTSGIKALQPAAQWSQQVATGLNMVSPIVGGDGIQVAQIPGVGTAISRKPITNKRGDILAIIVATGPSSHPDYTDNRYWFKEAYLHQTSTATVDSLARPELDPADNNSTHTFTNLSEAAGSTHSLTAGSLVWVTPLEGRMDGSAGQSQFTQYVAVEPLSGTITGGTSSSSGSLTLIEGSMTGTFTLGPAYSEVGTITLTSGIWEISAHVCAVITGKTEQDIKWDLWTNTSSYVKSGVTVWAQPVLAHLNGSSLYQIDADIPVCVLDNRTMGGTSTDVILRGSSGSVFYTQVVTLTLTSAHAHKVNW